MAAAAENMSILPHAVPCEQLGPPVKRPFIVADVAVLPRDLPSGPVDFELDNGRLVAKSPTGRRHGVLQARIAAALIKFGDEKGYGETIVETGVILRRNPDRLVGPDVTYCSKSSFPVRESAEGYLETIPDLVFEVRSKNDSDEELQRKIADCLAAGVKEAFDVDPDAKTVALHRAGTPPVVLGEPAVLRLEDVIPGFSLPLAELFRP